MPSATLHKSIEAGPTRLISAGLPAMEATADRARLDSSGTYDMP